MSDSEYYENNEYYENSELESQEPELDYPEEISKLNNNKKENIYSLQRLSDLKYSLIKEYYSGQIDLDVYFERNLKVENELKIIQQSNIDIDDELLEYEYTFLEYLEEYKKNIRSNESPELKKKIESFYSTLERIRNSYIVEETQPLFPINTNNTINTSTNESFESKLDYYLDLEEKSMRGIIKKYKLKEPLRSSFNNESEFIKAENKFYDTVKGLMDNQESIFSKSKREYSELKKNKRNIKLDDSITELFKELSISKKIIYPEKVVEEYILRLYNNKIKVPIDTDKKTGDLIIISKQYEEVWRLPIKNGNTYSFQKFYIFNEYLVSLKNIINNNIVLLNNDILLEKNIDTKLSYYNRLRLHKNKLILIDNYLSGNNISINIAPIKLLNNFKRNNTIIRLNRILMNESLTYNLEKYIFNNFNKEYFELVESLVFVLQNYNEVLLSFLKNEISVSQLCTIYKDSINNNETFSTILKWQAPNEQERQLFALKLESTLIKIKENKNSINNTNSLLLRLILFKKTLRSQRNNIKNINRVNSINKLINVFSNKLLLKVQSIIIRNFISTTEAKRIELIIYSLSESDNEYSRILKNVVILLSNDSRICNDIVKRIITYSQLIVLFESVIDNNNENIPENNTINIPEKINYSDMSLKQIDILLSHEFNNLKMLKDKISSLQAVNKSGIFILNWNPSYRVFTEQEIRNFESLKEKAVLKLKDLVLFENEKRNNIRLPNLSGNDLLIFS